ncbi:uncharacterized protein TRIADDRAFT_21854 [Trichoplax adhaerens]|uniref:Uncharacterized protein n=1 Tax=Trichoplax adhaerens TaxID=10228 RepID=B3RPX7_TRIAD|nr:hypothetical protein TRIADDRAFT_21854 [Trichoplax adhaerens]EDV28259.1 hypothetical protein TRIADDRAFT_21854 [Trichoplax adhaerens]|eukprot:XP_002110093.1 hypothetical protein TRIADDRAFT_21854 [Trichoplax adhaerens]
MGQNNNRYILITGCDSGFGNLLAKRLDLIGCHVFAACLTQQGVTQLAQSTSSRVKTFMMDVTQQQDIENAYSMIKAALPEDRGIWAVVNNAGILRTGLIDWMPMEEYKKVADVNLWGMVAVTKRFIPMVIREQGRFVNVVSLSGVLPYEYMGAYTISKFAAEGFTGVLRREMAPFNVQVSSIKPGVFRSSLVSPQPLLQNVQKMYENLPPETLENYDEEFISAGTFPTDIDK